MAAAAMRRRVGVHRGEMLSFSWWKQPAPRRGSAWLGLALTAGLASAAFGSPPAGAAPPGTPRITYTKVLKGSFPEYLSITVDRQGAAVYEGRKLDEAPSPREFQLGAETTQKIFSLAGALNHFASGDLESYKKVANLGRKTLIYDDGAYQHKVEFNYSQRSEAQDLVGIFERISMVAQYIDSLEHLIQFDHLRLPNQLRQIQMDLDRHALVEPQLMAPTLEKIVRNPRFLHLAQARAQSILQRIQAAP